MWGREEATQIEQLEQERLRKDLRQKYPNTIVCIEVRICCNAFADTGLGCDLPPGHEGKHYVISKQHFF